MAESSPINSTEPVKPLAATALLLCSVAGPAYLLVVERPHAGSESHRVDAPSRVSEETSSLLEEEPYGCSTRSIHEVADRYDRNPDATLEDETQARLVARTAIATGNTETFEQVRRTWNERETEAHAWLALDSDRLLIEGDVEAARGILQGAEFEGEKDVGRLIRLARLEASEDLTRALGYLDQAIIKAPRSGEAHLFRGQVLESLGRLREARVEYVTSIAADPANPFYRVALGDFYQRIGNIQLAVQSYRDAAAQDGGEGAWLKVAFWSTVAASKEEVGPSRDARPTPYTQLAQLISELPSHKFWDEAKFESLPGAVRFDRSSQEVYWLRALEHLRLGRDELALETLKSREFGARCWNRPLRNALERVICVRLGQDVPLVDMETENSHPLMQTLFARREADSELRQFLATDDAVCAVTLACGWTEAALRLPHSERCSNDAPHFLAFGLARAHQMNRPAHHAIEFALLQPASPEMDMLLGELHIGQGDASAAEAFLESASSSATDAGYRAGWMLATHYLSNSRLTDAIRVVERHPGLRESSIGSDLLARAHALRGDIAESEAALAVGQDQSLLARLITIQKALDSGDIETAQSLASQLLAVAPDSVRVRAMVSQLDLLTEQVR